MDKYQKLIAEGAQVIDVRTRAEFQAGHAENSRNIPLDELNRHVDELKALEKPLLLCCRSGARSGTATDMLTMQGIECYNVGPWQNAQKLMEHDTNSL